MPDDLSLLLKIRGDASSGKTAVAETRAALAQLRSTAGSEFNQIANVSNKAFSSITDNLNVFVSQRVPLVGGAFLRVLRGFGTEASNAEQRTAKLTNTIQGLSKETGKTSTEVTSFLTKFVQLGTQAERDALAISQFGAVTAQTLIPQLEKAGEEMAGVALASEGAGAGIAGMATPIGIAVIAIGALVVGGIILTKELFNLAESAADFRGKMFDLSQQTGVAIETLSTLEIAARTTGGSIDSIAQSLVIFQGKLDEAQDSSSKAGIKFRELGISTSDTETAFRQALAQIARIPEGFNQTNTAAELFGRRGGKQVLAILKELGGDLDGATEKFRELGLVISAEDAKAADEFNDQLAILQFQFRAALGKEIIPAALEALKTLSSLFAENREAITGFGQVLGLISQGILAAFVEKVKEVQLALSALEAAAHVLDRLRGVTPTLRPDLNFQPEGEFAAPGSVPPASAAEELQKQSAALKTANEEAKQLATERIAQAEIAFKLGQTTRKQETADIIAANRQRLEAEKAVIKAELAIKEEAFSHDQTNVKVLAEKTKLQQDLRDKDTAFAIESAQKQAELQIKERENLIAHEQHKRDISISAGEVRIALINSEVKEGVLAASEGEKQIEAIEAETFAARRAFLDKQLELAGKEPSERQKITDLIEALDQERTANAQRQADRRTEIERKESQGSIDLQIIRLDTILRLGEVSDKRQIAAIDELAALRVKTEEQAAKEILKLRLAAIDRENDAVTARLTAAESAADPQERAKQKALLNGQIQILTAERVSIEIQGNRDIEKGRQEDLSNERRYAKELITIQRDTARLIVDILIAHHASRKKIISAQEAAEIEDENRRHAQEQIRLAAIKADHELIEAEEERHRLALEKIAAETKAQLGEAKNSPVSAFDQLQTAINENLTGATFTTALAGLDAMREAFQGLGQAMGQVVQSFVLYGTAGASVRQVTAQILAGIAQQAAVKAVFELAEGFAMLALAFFGLPQGGQSAAAHFTAAAIYGGIAGIAAIAGRGVAGDSFKQPTSSTSSSTGRSGSSGGSQSPTPVEVNRNQLAAQTRVEVQISFAPGFDDVLEAKFLNRYNGGGRLRNTLLGDGGV